MQVSAVLWWRTLFGQLLFEDCFSVFVRSQNTVRILYWKQVLIRDSLFRLLCKDLNDCLSLALKCEKINEEMSLKIACGRVRLKHFSFLLCPLLCITHKQLFLMVFGPMVIRKINSIWNKEIEQVNVIHVFCLELYLLLLLFSIMYALYCIIFHLTLQIFWKVRNMIFFFKGAFRKRAYLTSFQICIGMGI